MNKPLPSAITSLLIAFLALVFPVVHAYATPSLLFDKTSVSVPQNTTFTVTININVDINNTVQSSRATLLYAAGDLDVVQVADGHFFPSFAQANDPTNGLLEITGYTTSAGTGSTAFGQLATVTFKAKKWSGSSMLSFGCTASGHDTNILSINGQNILNCGQTNTVAISYTGENTPTNTPTPTIPLGTTPTVTPTPTPGQSGNTIPTCVTLSSNTSLAVGTPLAVTFTCSGVDPDGYINAAEFTFGDNTSDTIYKNAGSPGSISTTHTYTTIGTLGPTCRVRDNNNVFSTSTNDCKRIIVINPKPVNVVAASYYQRVIAAGEKGSVIPVPVITPTPEVVTIVYETPTPIAPTVIPTLSLQPTKNPLENLVWWIVGSFVAILAAVLLLRRKNPPPPPYIQPPPAPPAV